MIYIIVLVVCIAATILGFVSLNLYYENKDLEYEAELLRDELSDWRMKPKA
jgi:hypothetical protein